MSLPPDLQKIYDQIGAWTKTEEFETFDKAVGAILDEHTPKTITLIAMIAKFIDIMERPQPGIGNMVVAVLAHRLSLPMIELPLPRDETH